MPSVGEKVNVVVAIRTILSFQFNRWAYYRIYATMTGAQLIVVWHDTNIEAYHLENHVDVPVWCIQNGHRLDVAPANSQSLFESIRTERFKQPVKASRYFVFGESSQRILEPFVLAEYVQSGSIRLNEYIAKRAPEFVSMPRREVPRIGFIVSFPNKSDVPGGYVLNNTAPFMRVKGKMISYNEYFAFDALVAQVLAELCASNQYSVSIIGKRSERDSIERDYFSKFPGLQQLKVIPHEKGSGYEVADEFDYLVTIDSTLGYEMLALGKRVAFLHNRYGSLGVQSEDLAFGYPLEIPNDGEFWCSATEPERIANFLHRLLQLSDQQWSQLHANVTPRLMAVEAGNTRLRSMVVSQLKATI
jgi:surface carbohydrate biosynthesis protein